MSKYKTPFPSEVESSKALENRTSKYRLPFKKDEPAEDLQTTLNNLSQHNIVLQTDLKLPKLAASTELSKSNPPRKHKNNLSIHEEVNMSLKSDREELFQNYNAAALATADPVTNEQQPRISQREVQESHRSKQESLSRPKLSMHLKKKRRYLSSASRYGDDEYADNTQQSESEMPLKKEKGQIPQGQLPVIGERRPQRQEKDESDQDIMLWENLAKDIELYQANKERQMLLRQKMRHKNSKCRKTLKKGNLLEDSQVQTFDSSNRKLIQQKRSRSFAQNPVLQEMLRQQKKSSPKNRIKTSLEEREMKESMNMMEKLKEIIAIRNQKLNRAKLKLPLQFYLNSYEQIKAINPFFRKLSQMEGCILLSIGKLVMFEANKSIYNEGDTSKEIYIIIYGKVLLSNKYKTLKKFALTGQTLGEEELFENEKSYNERLKEHSRPNSHRYDAKALNKSCLLRIQLSKYYKMSCQLHRTGFKQQFILIDNLFRINFLNKQTNLHYNARERIQTTEGSMPKPLSKHGAFFY